MDQSQNKEKAESCVPPGETADADFTDEMFAQGTIEQQEITLEKGKAEDLPETRARTMTEKVLSSILQQKKNPQGPQTSVFIQTSPNSTHSWPAPITAWKLKREQRAYSQSPTMLNLN